MRPLSEPTLRPEQQELATITQEALQSLQRRYMALQVKLSSLNGQAQELNRQKTTLTKSISLAKARLELAPQASEVFEYLQERAHARAVGEFEDLLSAFIQDVAPQAGQIRLELGTERGAPSLDIFIDNGGDLEGVLEGNGGGLTNLVVTGLAFSALSRTQNRQLIVLDEPDCWLKSTYVPALTKVIAQVANPQESEDGSVTAGCQTLMISHNDIAYMDEGAHIQELRLEYDLQAYADRVGLVIEPEGDPSDCAYVVWEPSNTNPNGALRVSYRHDAAADMDNNALTKGFPVVESVSGSKPFAPEHAGIRWIEVRNLRHHPYTRLELSAGLNVLAGDINSGKSTLYLTALRALAYGETDDTLIRHGANEACVRIGLENGIELEVVRKRKGSPRVLFRRYQDGILFHEARPESRNAVPDFITEALKISPVDDLDIQLRSQKQPVFLLNETPSKRARLLSVGKEAGLLQALTEKHRLNVRRDKDTVKREEVQYNQVNRSLKALAPLASLEGLIPLMDGLFEQTQKGLKQVEALQRTLGKLKPLASLDKLFTRTEEVALKPPCPPELAPSKELTDTTQALRALRPLSLLPIPQHSLHAPDAVQFGVAQTLSQLIGTLENLGARIRLNHRVITLPIAPKLVDATPLETVTNSIKKNQIHMDAVHTHQIEIGREAKIALDELLQCEAQLGVCPTCNRPFEHHGAHHAH